MDLTIGHRALGVTTDVRVAWRSESHFSPQTFTSPSGNFSFYFCCLLSLLVLCFVKFSNFLFYFCCLLFLLVLFFGKSSNFLLRNGHLV